MVISRRSFIACLGALLGPRAADAQRSGHVPRIGILCPHRLSGARGMPRDVFEHALGGLGWTPGSNVELEYRDAEKNDDALAEGVLERSEEHTSELSQSNLVCRLLLEKKKKSSTNTY